MKKQPDKITAYYYRAANKQIDLNLDNQMHRLLSHAQENRSDTYMFFVDAAVIIGLKTIRLKKFQKHGAF